MITITIPEWMLWLVGIYFLMNTIEMLMKIYIWFLKRKINKLYKDKLK